MQKNKKNVLKNWLCPVVMGLPSLFVHSYLFDTEHYNLVQSFVKVMTIEYLVIEWLSHQEFVSNLIIYQCYNHRMFRYRVTLTAKFLFIQSFVKVITIEYLVIEYYHIKILDLVQSFVKDRLIEYMNIDWFLTRNIII